MKVILRRNIFFHSASTGLISKVVFKVYNWEVPPVIGATVDDSAWHRNDITKIESIFIEADIGDAYYVDLNPLIVENPSLINKYVEIAESHDWRFDSQSSFF